MNKYRSKYERRIAKACTNKAVRDSYEKFSLSYTYTHKYTPDFQLPNGVFIEAKGLFKAADRTKHLLIKKQHPDIDIRFLFMNPSVKIRKNSRTTYANWCDKNGFLWAKGPLIPKEWYK